MHVRSEHPGGAACARQLAAGARRYLRALGREGAELSILLVGDKAIRRLNRTWRGKDVATDVLSFPAAARGPFLGDVVISLDTARRVAAEEGRALADELQRYLAHAILHLLGHDHEQPAQARRMAEAEDALVGEGMVSAAAPRGARSVRAPTSARPERSAAESKPTSVRPERSAAESKGGARAGSSFDSAPAALRSGRAEHRSRSTSRSGSTSRSRSGPPSR